jgi:hypothetical protein
MLEEEGERRKERRKSGVCVCVREEDGMIPGDVGSKGG